MTERNRKRRHNGEGSVYQRKDGMWMASVTLPDGDLYKRGRAKYEDAVDLLRQMLKDLDNGVDPSKGTVTVEKWMTYWLNEIAADRLRPRTLASYRSTVKQQIIPHLGRTQIRKLTPADIRRMVRKVTAEKSSRTAQIAFNVLSPALGDAVKDGQIPYNPCDRMHRPAAKSESRGALTVNTAKAVLLHAGASGDARAAARWALSLMSGVRQAEALGLTWDRVDFERDVIDVTLQLQRLKLVRNCRPADPHYPRELFDVRKVDYDFVPVWRAACLVNTKTDGSRRMVPMIAPLRAALLALRDAGQSNVGGLVFARADGTPLTPADDTGAWRQLCVDAGIVAELDKAPDQHVGRHTTATLLLEAGVPESTRMAILGHTTVTAHREYAHVDVGPQREALSKLGDILALGD